MRTRISEIISSIDFYNRETEFGTETWDIKTDFTTPPNMTLLGVEGVVDVIKEFFDYKGNTEDIIMDHKPVIKKCEYVLTFEEYVKQNPNVHSNFQKFPSQDPDYDNRPKGWGNDDFNDDLDEEE